MYLQLQTMLTAALGVVWVTSGGGIKTISPELRMVDGLLRVLRTENLEKRFATLALEAQLIDEVTTAKKIATVIRQTFESDIYEPEYVEKGGILHIPRLLENHSVGDSVRAKTTVTRTRQPLRELPPVTLHIETPGLLDTLTFIDDETVHKPLQPREIEIQVHAVGVNFMDCLTALGRINQSTFGGVVRAGDDSRFKPGDRVCAFVLDCYKTLMRLDERLAVKFPDSLSFSEAAAVPVTVCTSYHALVKVARLQRGESILIQAAAGGTGQAAVQIAKLIGAEIFATVGSDEKKRFLMDEYGIPEDHIFFSRNTTFAQGILRVTKGRGVDVVLNSLAGQFLVAGFECIASYGRFVEIGKADTHSDTATLPMLPFARNVSFSAVDLAAMTIERPDLVQVLLQSVMGFVELGSVSHAKPLHLYRISEVEDAFRFLQSGKSTGKVVCQMGHNDEVNVRSGPCFVMFKTNLLVGATESQADLLLPLR
jgi:NADPH:quinone reductase-like Zn-dependent oxidoreductase